MSRATKDKTTTPTKTSKKKKKKGKRTRRGAAFQAPSIPINVAGRSSAIPGRGEGGRGEKEGRETSGRRDPPKLHRKPPAACRRRELPEWRITASIWAAVSLAQPAGKQEGRHQFPERMTRFVVYRFRRCRIDASCSFPEQQTHDVQ